LSGVAVCRVVSGNPSPHQNAIRVAGPVVVTDLLVSGAGLTTSLHTWSWSFVPSTTSTAAIVISSS
jgi:hypothetical protein